MDYVVLKAELETDPKNLGYTGKNEEEIAALINTIGLSGETVSRGIIDSHEVVSACEWDELKNLSGLEQAQLSFIVGAGQVDTSNSKIKGIFAGLFGQGTQTRANLLALATRPGSRAEILNLVGVKYWDIARARAL